MSLRLYLFTVVFTWGAGFVGFYLIKFGMIAAALWVLLGYWLVVLFLAFKIDVLEDAQPYRFIGASDPLRRKGELE